jgi:ankyrin repeat protein
MARTYNKFLENCRDGYIDKVKTVVNKNKVNINRRDKQGKTGLEYACSKERTDVVDFLLSDPLININNQNEEGETALHIACTKNNTHIVESLISHGADINIKNKNGETPLYVACSTGRNDIIEVLINHKADLYTKTNYDYDPFRVLCFRHNIEGVELFLSLGYPLNNIKTELQKAMLFIYEIKRLNIEKIKELLELGVKVNYKTRCNYTALHLMCENDKCLPIVKLLISFNANIESITDGGWTPLHIACHQGSYEIAKYLIEKKADVNAFTNHRMTPLHFATYFDHGDIVKLLLENGADTEMKDDSDLTALEVAKEEGLTEIIDIFENYKK